MKDTLLSLAIRFGPRLLVAILILVAGLLVSRAVSRWMLRLLHRLELEQPVRLLLARVAWAASFVFFVIMALQNLGGRFSTTTAVSGSSMSQWAWPTRRTCASRSRRSTRYFPLMRAC